MIINEKGSTSIISLAVLAAVLTLLTFMTNRANQRNKLKKNSNQYEASSLATLDLQQQAQALGGFLISNNLILCKESIWNDTKPANSCRFGGGSHVPIKSLADFGLSNETYIDDNYVVDFQIKNSANTVINTGKLSFILIDLHTNVSTKEALAKIPHKYSWVDDDRFAVRVLVERGNIKTTVYYRRPIGKPKITIGQSICSNSCKSAYSENPEYECRGAFRTIPGSKAITGDSKTTNLGPGPIYRLSLYKQVILNPSYFPNTPNPDGETILADNGKDFIMPGEIITWTDSVDCAVFTRSVAAATPPDPQANNNHYMDAGAIYYRLEASAFDQTDGSANMVNYLADTFHDTESATGVILTKGTYDRENPTSFQPNPNLSLIEPKKLTTRYQQAAGNIPRSVEQIYVPVRVIHTH